MIIGQAGEAIISYYTNGTNSGCLVASPDTILKLHTLGVIQAKFDKYWSRNFRGDA
jgi:hypothetical protein